MPSLSDSVAIHGILSFSILAFIPFVSLKYQQADASPFDDGNSIMILVFFIATSTYVAAMVAEFKLLIRNAECPNIIISISHLSAPLASISLVIILFPYLGLFLLVIWVGYFVKTALDAFASCQELFQPLSDAARGASQLIREKLLHLVRKNDDEINHQSPAAPNTTFDSTV